MLGMQTLGHACVECRESAGINCMHGKCFVINFNTLQKKEIERVAPAIAKIVHQVSVDRASFCAVN